MTPNIRCYKSLAPAVHPSCYVDPAATVIGDVTIGPDCSIWPQAVLRGDVNSIRIGRLSNIQDGTVVHVTHRHAGASEGHPVVVGDEVTIGHNVTVHGCTIGDRCLIGMGAILLDGARLENEVLLGAGSLVPPGKVLEGGYLWLGSPVKRVRPLNEDELAWLTYSAAHYGALKNDYMG